MCEQKTVKKQKNDKNLVTVSKLIRTKQILTPFYNDPTLYKLNGTSNDQTRPLHKKFDLQDHKYEDSRKQFMLRSQHLTTAGL